MKKLTEEEKAAKKLADLLSDLRLDLDLIGYYFANNFGSVLYNRLLHLFESAEQEKEDTNGNYIR